LRNVIAIGGGYGDSLVLKSDGTVAGWGLNADREATSPAGMSGVISLSVGQFHNLALVAAPTILVPPATQTAEAGSTVRLSVRSAGGPVYQWLFNGTPISGGTNSSLRLPAVQASQAGSYTVWLTNLAGAITSSPAMLNVIPPVERRPAPALTLTGQPGTFLNLEYAEALPPQNWLALDSVALINSSQFYFDPSAPLPERRFYRASQISGLPPMLDLRMVPAITLTGTVGTSVRLDYINAIGPTNAWVSLASVVLTNTSQLYFDSSASGQAPRLYRVIPLP
jgi:hypothetical protein